MEDLDNGTLCDMIASMGEHLEDIMSEKVPCERMFTFLHGTESERIGLSHNCPMGHFTDHQHELIIHELSNMLPKNTKNLELVLKVLFPEVMIKIYQTILDKDYDDAEKKLFEGKVRTKII